MGTAKAKTKEVATTEEAGAVGAVFDYGEDAGSGYEGQTAADKMIPFLNVLQGLSPQCQGEESTARPGMLCDSATNETYSGKTGVLFVPCLTQHVYCEWTPRDEGGGLVATYLPGDPAVEEAMRFAKTRFGKIRNEAGNDLVETFYVYGVVCAEDGDPVGPAALALSSTKIKPYRGWMTRLGKFTVVSNGRKIRPPLFAHLTRITTVEEKRAAGTSFNIVFTPAVGGDLAKSLLAPSDPRFQTAKEWKELVATGKAKVDNTGGAASEDGDGGKPPF